MHGVAVSRQYASPHVSLNFVYLAESPSDAGVGWTASLGAINSFDRKNKTAWSVVRSVSDS